MRTKWMTSIVLVVILLAAVGSAAAQNPSVEWEAWNAQITAYADDQQIDVAETQIVNVLDGSLGSGSRNYSQPVEIQDVYLALNNSQPQALVEGDGPGSYQIFNDSGDVVLEYQLPQRAEAGDTFVVQINYSTETATPGLIDWYPVPGDHGAPVNSSTITLNFPDGQAPDPSFVRLIESNGTVNVSGNSIIIQSQGVIQPNQAFGIQVPFGESIGVPGNSGSGSNPNPNPVSPSQPAPTGGSGDSGLGSILPILCVIGVLILFGGGNMLRGLLGGLGGGSPVGGSSPLGRSGNPLGGLGGRGSSGTSSGSGRGFRESSNQDRSTPTVSSDKRRGGGASFK
jgi:hypothetical protein